MLIERFHSRDQQLSKWPQPIATQESSHMWKELNSHRNGRDTHMDAVWLFMADVTSCEKALYS